MKQRIVQLWGLSLLLLNISCTLESSTKVPYYTLTPPPVSNQWDLDIYSNSPLSALALIGPQGQGNLGNLSLAPLMNAINQTAVVPTSGPVVAQFTTTSGQCSVKFFQGSTEIATYTMPAHNPLEPFAWLQPWVGTTPLGIDIYAVAIANGTINIRLHINSTVTTPTYSLGQVWNLDVVTYDQRLNAFNITGPYPDSAVTSTVNPAYLFAALNNILDTSNSVRVAFRSDKDGHYADLFDSSTSDSSIPTFLGTYTLLNVPNNPSHNTALAWVDFTLGTTAIDVNPYQDIAQQNDIINIRFHSAPPPVVKQWYPNNLPGFYDIYFNGNVPGGITFQTPDIKGILGGMGMYIIPTLQDTKSAAISCDYANGQYNCSYPGGTFNLKASSSTLSIYVGPENVSVDQYYKISQEFDCTKQIFLRFNPGVPPTTAPSIPTLQGSSPGIAATINMNGLELTSIEFSADGITWVQGPVKNLPSAFFCMSIYASMSETEMISACTYYPDPNQYAGPQITFAQQDKVLVYVRINGCFVFNTGIMTYDYYDPQTITIKP